MKKIILLLVCLISIVTSAINHATTGATLSATKELVNPTIPLNCPGDISLSTQIDIDNFVINYGCSVITGTLYILNNNNITNLNGLYQLTSVGGLYFQNVPNLTNYSGLNNLATITGNFNVFSESSNAIVGFPSLTTIGGVLDFSAVVGLTSVSGFNNLLTVGNLIFGANPNLISINGFSSLQSITDILYIVYNENLQTISGFSSLNYVANYVISKNAILQQLPNTPLLTTINSLDIHNNPLLLNLNGLNGLTTVNTSLFLATNNSLNSISALNNLTSVSNFSINDCNSLTSLTGIENIIPSTINSVTLYGNSQLSVCSMPNICSFIDNGGSVYINSNAPGCNSRAQVLVACGIPQSCSGNIFLFSQADVDDFVLNYGCTAITETLTISGNDITNLNGLSQLVSVGNLNISSNPLLTNLNGLNGLTTINGDFYLTSNSSLNSITALSNLTLLSSIWITECNALISLSGIENISTYNLFIQIYNNSQLSVCNMTSICNTVSFQGGYITSNAPGCNSTSEVLSACGVSLNCQASVIYLSSQADVDNFAVNYGCSVFSGILSISGNDITNLNGLSQLTALNSLSITGNPLLVNLTGLHNLEHVISINIISNNALSTINALSGLQSAYGINIKGNTALTSLSGLHNISPTFNYFYINGNYNLSTCAIASICDKITADGLIFLHVSSNGSNCSSPQEIADICSPNINLKLFIEGFYLNGETMQSVVLNQSGYSPLDVENITVELHDAVTFELVRSSTAVLKTDGTAVCSFLTDPPTGSFYIVIKTRNAIQTWSANPQSLNPLIPLIYDFTTAASQAYGDNMVEVEPNVWAFYSGDINQDEAVDPTDYSLWEPDANNFVFGVTVTDLNGDGAVDPTDYSIWEQNANNFVFAYYPQ